MRSDSLKHAVFMQNSESFWAAWKPRLGFTPVGYNLDDVLTLLQSESWHAKTINLTRSLSRDDRVIW